MTYAEPLLALQSAAREYQKAMESRQYEKAEELALDMRVATRQLLEIAGELNLKP